MNKILHIIVTAIVREVIHTLRQQHRSRQG
jgi:hypothetical protein